MTPEVSNVIIAMKRILLTDTPETGLKEDEVVVAIASEKRRDEEVRALRTKIGSGIEAIGTEGPTDAVDMIEIERNAATSLGVPETTLMLRNRQAGTSTDAEAKTEARTEMRTETRT